MRWSKIFITIKKELRAIVRDRKSFLIILVTPLIIPFFVFLMSFIYDFMMQEDDTIYEIGTNYELNSNEKSIVTEIGLNTKKYDSKEDLDKAYENKDIVAYIYLDNNKYEIYANINDVDGSEAATLIQGYLTSYNDFLAENYLMSEDIDKDKVFNNIEFDLFELEGENYLVSIVSGMALPYVIMVLMLTAITCATDLTAGEKERGTLETLLTFPISGTEIVSGKFLAITLATTMSGILSFVLALVSLKISINSFDFFKGVVFDISLYRIVMALLIIISSSLIVSGLAIAIAIRANSFKEAQSSLQPLSFLAMVPMLLSMFETETNIFISMIPLVGQGMLLNDLFGESISTTNILVMFVSSIIFIIIIIWLISRQFKSEKVLFSL